MPDYDGFPDIEIEEESFERERSGLPPRGEELREMIMEIDGDLSEMFMESDIEENNPPHAASGNVHINDEEMEERRAEKRKRDTANRSGMSS